MRKFLSYVFAALVIGISAVAAQSPGRVLFIGNSYTGVNQLPAVFGEVVKSATHASPLIKSATPGGQTLHQQLGQKPSLELIDEGNWDVVVLQGNSLEAAAAETYDNVRAEFLDAAGKLCERVRAKSPKAKIYFYETWARHADYWKALPKDAPDVGKDPTEMQARIRKWYSKAAEVAKPEAVVPAGDAWELNYQNPDAIRLHAPDNSHPLFAGTYLVALVFYQTIYHPEELKVTWHGNLKADEAKYLQGIASKAGSQAPKRGTGGPPVHEMK